MSRVSKVLLLSLAVGLVAGLVLFAGSEAAARPAYCKTFIAEYPKVEAAKEAKCAICHPKADDKDVRNNYGQVLGKLVGENEKDAAKIKASLKKAEGEKSAVPGKTFGDLLKEGKLPASK
jgi:hypothetical protein